MFEETFALDLASDKYVEVRQDFYDVRLRGDGIVVLKRRNVAYRGIGDLNAGYDAFLATVDDWLLQRRIKAGAIGTRRRVPMAWLLDLQDAPRQRNDAEFEETIKKRRSELFERSPWLAILVSSTSGKMQLTRITHGEPNKIQVSNDLDTCIRGLRNSIRGALGHD